MGHSEVSVPDTDRYDRLQARRRHANTRMHGDSTETNDPIPDGSTLQMLLFSGTVVNNIDTDLYNYYYS